MPISIRRMILLMVCIVCIGGITGCRKANYVVCKIVPPEGIVIRSVPTEYSASMGTLNLGEKVNESVAVRGEDGKIWRRIYLGETFGNITRVGYIRDESLCLKND
jgi:hypothetical protein